MAKSGKMLNARRRSCWDCDNDVCGNAPCTCEAPERTREKREWQREAMEEHWYFMRVGECYECGYEEVNRERRYGARPESREDRYEYRREHCGCLHFD